MAVVGRPSREQAIAWARGHCPDLRIQHDADGAAARFTVDGRVVELETNGPNAGDELAQRIWEAIREAHDMPVRPEHTSSDVTLEREILAARLAGQDDVADRLSAQYVMRGEGIRAPQRRLHPRDIEPRLPEARQQLYGTRKVY